MSYDITSAQMDALQDLHARRPHAPSPHPYEYRGANTCDQCGCAWKMYDLSEPNPIDAECREPVKWHPLKCLCHSEPYVTGLLDERARIAEEVVMPECICMVPGYMPDVACEFPHS